MHRDWDRYHLGWAWLGGQIGCSGWILLSGILAGWAGSLLTALYVLALFACLNGIGYLLWSSRGRLRLQTALTVLILASGASGAAAIYVLDSAGLWEAVQLEPWVYTAETSYLGWRLYICLCSCGFPSDHCAVGSGGYVRASQTSRHASNSRDDTR